MVFTPGFTMKQVNIWDKIRWETSKSFTVRNPPVILCQLVRCIFVRVCPIRGLNFKQQSMQPSYRKEISWFKRSVRFSCTYVKSWWSEATNTTNTTEEANLSHIKFKCLTMLALFCSIGIMNCNDLKTIISLVMV